MLMRRRRVLPAALLASVLLAGCGQTGPLYFDEAPPADQLPPSKKQQPVSTIPQPVPEADGKVKK